MRKESDLQEAPFLSELAIFVYSFNVKQKATILGIGMSISFLCTIMHETLGHLLLGCLAAGYTPLTLTSFFAECDGETAPFGWVAAAGTVMDLILGGLLLTAFTLYRRFIPKTLWSTSYYVLWLATLTFLLHGFGYMVTSPLFYWGDWNIALKDVPHNLYYRIAATVLGLAGSIVTFAVWAFRTLQPMLGKEVRYKFHRALWLCTIPYLVNSSLVSLIALITGPRFALTTLVNTFGGAFPMGLLGVLTYYRRMHRVEGIWVPDPPITVNRSPFFIGLGVVSLILYVVFAFGVPWMSGPMAGWGHALF